MPEVKNCLTCRFEPEWRVQYTGLFGDRKEVSSYGCRCCFGCDCQMPSGHIVEVHIPYLYVEEDKAFWNGEDVKEQEITDCPAWQPKKEGE